jgi:competence protein ComEC
MAPVSLAAMTGVMLAGLSGRWSPRYGGYWPPLLLIVLILIWGVRFG